MNNWHTPQSFIIIAALLVHGNNSAGLFEAVSNAEYFQQSPQFFQSTSYLIGYCLTWNLLFEISLIIVLHFKQNAFYVAEHSFINMMVLVIQLANNFLLLKNFNYNFGVNFVVLECVITGAAILQLVLGGALNKKLQSEKLIKGIFILRFLHKNWGRMIYLMTKYQIAAYAYYYFQGSAVSSHIFVSLLFGITCITHVSLWIILNAHATDDIEVNDYLINTSSKGQIYMDLLRNIDAGEVDYNPDLTMSDRMSEMNLQETTTQLVPETEQIAWVIIEDKVFDITGLRHPKGNYILKSVKYRDITREIYGLKGWRFSEGGYVKISKHRHVARTFEFLKKHCIGEMSPNSSISGAINSTKLSISQNNSSLNLFDTSQLQVNDYRKLRINSWKAAPSYNFDDNTLIHFLYKNEKDHVVNLSSFWLRNFGRYFLIKGKNGVNDFYYATFSLSPRYLVCRKQWFDKLNLPLLKRLESKMSSGYRDLADLSSSLLKSVGNDFAALMNNSDDVRDPFLPLLHYSSAHSASAIADDIPLKINGPLGLGIGFEPNSTKKIVIIVKDSGILPFVDFFEYLGQRSVIELTELKIPHPIFGKEYLLYYINEIAIWVYWEISDDFWETAQMLGIFGIETINEVSKEQKFNKQSAPGQTDFTKIVNVLRKVHLVTGKSERSDNKITETNSQANNFAEVLKSVAGTEMGAINRAVVSGDIQFVNRVLKNVSLPSNQVVIL
jgi:cytochrome b involved in lipid metabolism